MPANSPIPKPRPDALLRAPTGPSVLQEAAAFRTANGGREAPSEFVSNSIRTAKYTPLDFVPRAFFGQFHRLGNQYFLVQTIVMVLGEYSTLYPSPLESWSMIAVLLFVVGLSMCFEARDDFYRHKKDHETNSSMGVSVTMRTGVPSEVTKPWQDFNVGEIVLVRKGEPFPADLVLLTSSEVDGNCYVETANIDGETNLKLRLAVKDLSDKLQGGVVGDLPGAMRRTMDTELSIEAMAPTASIYSFNGTLTVDQEDTPLSEQQFLHRGSVLRNTTWILGLIVYTGAQTKIVLNSADPPIKRSTIDKTVDRILIVVIIAQCLLVTVADIGFVVQTGKDVTEKDDLGYHTTWYLIPQGESNDGFVFPNWLAYWLSYFILFNNFVPINIYVTMDLCNLLQGVFINNDLAIYCEETDTPGNCRASNLCQELGQIEYIFSDKTGTLTQNLMTFKKCAIGSVRYGTSEGAFTAEALTKKLNKGQDKQIERFLEILAVAHTVVTDQEGQYQAESPDEAALVDAAAKAGFKFASRRGETVSVDVQWEKKTREYVVEAVNTFSSKRKRMSVVVRDPSGKYLLFIKGADNMILDRAEAKTDAKDLNDHLTAFSCEGLRTLLAGYRQIPAAEFKSWKKMYDKATTHVGSDRGKMLEDAAEAIEKNICVSGVTAIEDKLQEDVADTISNMADAGIKLWVLTGDKVETAINIGYSCKVLVPGMKVLKIVSRKPEHLNLRLENIIRQIREAAGQSLSGGGESKDDDAAADDQITTVQMRNLALVITGPALEQIMSHDIRRAMLLELGVSCKVVIACRVSPLQKSQLVDMVREGIVPEPITLSIGDGANDVSMIQRAHVGVGISGNEGQQAANVADFSISKFKYLQRLLLVHGRWNYRRICKVITYVFYKNFCLTLTLFYFSAVTLFSGTSLYDSWIYTSFNIHTMLPICAIGTLDQDVREEFVMKFPALYLTGRMNLDLNPSVIFQYILLAILHSFIVMFWPYFSYFGLDQVDLGGIWVFGTLVFSCLIFTVQYRVMVITSTWTSITGIVLAISFFLFFLMLLIYGIWYTLSWDYYWASYKMMGSGIFWVVLFGVPATALYFDFVLLWFHRELRPGVMDFAVEADFIMNKEKKEQAMEEVLKTVKRNTSQVRVSSVHEDGVARISEMEDITKGAEDDDEKRDQHGFAFSHPGATPAPVQNALTTSSKQPKDSKDRKSSVGAQQTSRSRQQSDGKDGLRADIKEISRPHQLASKRPLDESTWCGRFLQQKLPRHQRPLTPKVIITVLTCVGLLFFLLGGLVISGSNHASYQMIQYDGNQQDYEDLGYKVDFQACRVYGSRNLTYQTCNVTFTLDQDMEAPVFVHYGLNRFYQNYQTYAADHYYMQLDGTEADPSSAYCSYYTEAENGEKILPCGLQANTMFNDTFRLVSPSGITMHEDAISWKVDRDIRFDNPSGYPDICNSSYKCLHETYPGVVSREQGVKDEHFMVWMRTAALPNFMKKYGRIEENLKKGDTLTFEITARFVVDTFGGSKAIILTKDSWIGGQNNFMGIAMVTMGGIVIATVIGMLLKECYCPRTVGTQQIVVEQAAAVERFVFFFPSFFLPRSFPSCVSSRRGGFVCVCVCFALGDF